MRVILFFSYGVSLKDWKSSGLFEREVKFYKYIQSKKNINVTFVTYGDKSDYKYQEEISNIEIIPIYELYKKHKNKIQRIIYSLVIGFKLRNKLSYRNSNVKTNQLWGSWVAILYSLFTTNNLIIRTGYDLLTFKEQEKNSKIKIFLYWLVTQISLIFGNHYIVTSETDGESLKSRHLFQTNKIKVIPNWIDLKVNDQLKSNSFISVGRFEKQKNFDKLIESFSNSGEEITLIGDGSLKKDLYKLSKKLNSKINFEGILSNEEVIKKLSKHKFYIHTALYEGNPKTILEAMSVGCVVIVPSNPNILEIVQDNFNGIVYDQKKDNLKDIIQNIKNKDVKQISQNAIATVKKNNSLEKIVDLEFLIYK